MTSRLDLILFGATGFTGKLTAGILSNVCKSPQYSDLRWGLAGRSGQKLKDLLQDIQACSGADTSNVPIIIADVKDEKSLVAMTAQTKVLMNSAGPYSVLGEPVVQACLHTKTNYVDITAELYFMLDTYRKFHSAAEEAGVVLVTACGYGSVPAALGAVYLEKHFQGVLHSIDCYTELKLPKRLYFPTCNNTLVSYGTWSSLLKEFEHFKEYQALKSQTFPEEIYESHSEDQRRSFFHRQNGKVWIPYPGPDKEIIDMTQRYLYAKKMKKPVKFDSYTTMPLFIHLILLVPAFFILYYASVTMSCFKKLLLKFPAFFTLGYMSKKGPSERNMSDTKFSFVLKGKGWTETKSGSLGARPQSNKTMTVKVSGSNPYRVSALIFVLSAIVLLRESDKVPKGGVLTTASAFYHTSLVDLLNSHGLMYEIVEY